MSVNLATDIRTLANIKPLECEPRVLFARQSHNDDDDKKTDRERLSSFRRSVTAFEIRLFAVTSERKKGEKKKRK